jgi:hypothetical protein
MISKRLLGPLASTLALAALLFCTAGCTPPPVHPNQFDSFDGAAYDSLTVAHAALSSLRTSIGDEFPQYTHAFNEAADAYNKGVTSYTTFRSTHDELGIHTDLQSLTVALVLLETEIQSGFHATPSQSNSVRASAGRIRARAAQAHVTVSDILTELEIATALAQTVPSAGPYARLARAVITATADAISAQQLYSGKPIDLQTLPLLDPLS